MSDQHINIAQIDGSRHIDVEAPPGILDATKEPEPQTVDRRRSGGAGKGSTAPLCSAK
ncbi:MAG: hypothetical protein J2P17_33780 [Mycobacterium sp.]|nr:hypothetical protein [Mycobacterium sp.]